MQIELANISKERNFNDKILSFVSRCSHFRLKIVTFRLLTGRRWGRLFTRNLIKHYAPLWLVDFQQLWLVRFDLYFSGWLLPQRPAFCSSLVVVFHDIVGIHASETSIPLSLLMLLGWSLMWIASLTLRVYQCGSRSINFTSSQSG